MMTWLLWWLLFNWGSDIAMLWNIFYDYCLYGFNYLNIGSFDNTTNSLYFLSIFISALLWQFRLHLISSQELNNTLLSFIKSCILSSLMILSIWRIFLLSEHFFYIKLIFKLDFNILHIRLTFFISHVLFLANLVVFFGRIYLIYIRIWWILHYPLNFKFLWRRHVILDLFILNFERNHWWRHLILLLDGLLRRL